MLTELGKELFKARKDKKNSLEAVAKPAKISNTYLQKLERGEINNPSPRVLGRLAVVLEISYLNLLLLAGYLNEDQLAEAQLLKSLDKPHPFANKNLSKEEWRAVGAFIKYLIAQSKK